MKAFSALYFIRENKIRCILLMFMISFGYAAYLGGLYVTNISDNWRTAFEYDKKTVLAYSGETEEEQQEFEIFKERVQKENKVKALLVSGANRFMWEAIMGFEEGSFAYTFSTVDDFELYCEYMDIHCDFSNIKEGSMIMSGRFAKNKGLELGDSIDKSYEQNIYGNYTLDAVTTEDGYTLYFIDKELAEAGGVLLFQDGFNKEELIDYIGGFYSHYDKTNLEETIMGQLEVFNFIYLFILVLMAVILAVTIQAAFVGMYQRRVFEFAVYRAIGISKFRVIGKIAGELLWMDLIALAAGGIFFFSALYLFNHIVLYPKGLYIRYYHPIALSGLALCNIIVVAPLILTRCRRMLKADICEY